MCAWGIFSSSIASFHRRVHICACLQLWGAYIPWYHWRKLLLVLTQCKTFFAIRNFHNSVLLICGADSQTWVNCKIALVQSVPSMAIHCTPDSEVIFLWGIWPCFSSDCFSGDSTICGAECHKWQPAILRKAETGTDYILICCSSFMSIWVMPAAGPEKSEVMGNKACCKSRSSFLQPEPCCYFSTSAARESLPYCGRETWEIK